MDFAAWLAERFGPREHPGEWWYTIQDLKAAYTAGRHQADERAPMANFTDNLTSATNTTAQQIRSSEKQLRWTFTGSYTGATGYPQGSNDGTNFVNLTGVREDTGAAFNGQIGATNFSMVANIGGWAYVRFNLTAVTGTITIRGDTGASFSLPLGTTPISLDSVGQTVTASTFAAGANGGTNPAFKVDGSAGSAATGLKVTAAAAGSGVAIAVISSGSNDALTLDALGTGSITIGSVSTGNVVLGTSGHTLTLNNTTGAVTLAAGGLTLTTGNLLLSSGTATVTSTSASAFCVGRQGATDPVLKVNANTGTVATGVSITGAAAAGRVAIAAISSGTNEGIDFDAKGSGTIRIGATSTGNVLIGGGGGIAVLTGTLTAGGLLTCALQVATSGPLVYSGSGAPTVSAAVKGSIYLRSDGSSTSTRMYVATDTAGTWTGVTTAA
jgi:hypothetical protein